MMKKSLLWLSGLLGMAFCCGAEIVPDYHFTAETLFDTVEDNGEVREWFDTENKVAFVVPQNTRRPVQPPLFKERILNGNPAVYFDGTIRTLHIPGFVNKVMAGKSFTFIYGAESITGFFGFAGNNPDGSVTAPKLEMQCGRFTYNKSDIKTISSVKLFRVNGFIYDAAARKAYAYYNGKLINEAEVEAVPAFGGSGDLVVPFMPWPHAPRQGILAEVMIFQRALTPDEMLQLSNEIRARNR